jgi:hypothetical protein
VLPEDTEDKRVLNSDLLKEYEDISIKGKKWGAFESSDIRLNDVRVATSVLNFVAKFEGKLDSKPVLAPDVRCFSDLSVHLLILAGQCRRVPPKI